MEHVRRTEQLIKTCLLHSFYRTGDFETASRLEAESKLQVDLNLRQTYAELNQLLDALRDGDISPSLSYILYVRIDLFLISLIAGLNEIRQLSGRQPALICSSNCASFNSCDS